MNPANNKRKNETSCDGEFVKETKKFVSIFSNISFTCIKENFQKCLLQTQLTRNRMDSKSTIGYFYLLPEEIVLKIMKLLTIEELSILVMVNSKIRNFIIENFLINTLGYRHLIRANQIELNERFQKHILNLFSSVGLLLKRSTLLFPTNERIYLLINTLENTYGMPSIKCIQYFDFSNFKLIFKCYGAIINKLITGWGDFECVNMFKTLKDVSRMDVHLDKFLNSSLGSKQTQELLIRNFFRMICNSCDSGNFKEKLFWLINTVKIYSVEEISKIFIVIFGPLITINNLNSLPYIAWWDLTDSFFIESGLEDLGLTIHYLYKHNLDSIWTIEYIIEIFDSIVHTPTTWIHMNIATLLYYSGQEFTLDYLRRQLKIGDITDVASCICHLNIITYKFSKELTSILKLIDTLINEYSEDLIEEIAQGFSTIVYDISIDSIDEEKDNLDVTEVIESQIELMKLLMFKIVSLKKFI